MCTQALPFAVIDYFSGLKIRFMYLMSMGFRVVGPISSSDGISNGCVHRLDGNAEEKVSKDCR